MQRGRLRSELHESVALLRAETWLFAGVGLAWATYGGWVVATGLLLQQVATGFADTVFTTVAGVAVSLFTVIAAGLWLVVPALAAVVLVNRRLRNDYGNLADAYRLDHPSLLVAVPGAVLVGCLLLRVALGPHPLLSAAVLVGTVHLVVRTVAYGHRVYTFSVLPLLSLLVFVTGLCLGSAWLVAATTAPAVLSAVTAQAGVGPVVETGLRIASVGAPQAMTTAVAVPGGLATAYLFAQLVAGTVVRARAPLANPQRRPDQRFPVMPPVGGPRDDAQTAVVAPDEEPEGRDQPAEPASDRRDDPDPDSRPSHTGTRVFAPDEVAQSEPPTHESTGADTAASEATGQTEPSAGRTPSGPTKPVENDDDASETSVEDGDDDASETLAGNDDTTDSETPVENDPDSPAEEWVDDTEVFTPGSRDAAPSYCGECGESLSPGDRTCPSCGESVER